MSKKTEYIEPERVDPAKRCDAVERRLARILDQRPDRLFCWLMADADDDWPARPDEDVKEEYVKLSGLHSRWRKEVENLPKPGTEPEPWKVPTAGKCTLEQARAEALNSLAGLLAERTPDVAVFRQKRLGGRLLAESEVSDWAKSAVREDVPLDSVLCLHDGDSPYNGGVREYRRRRPSSQSPKQLAIEHHGTWDIVQGGVLDELRLVSEEPALIQTGWRPDQVARFVLTGNLPATRPAVEVHADRAYEVPALSRITLNVDFMVPPEMVYQEYGRVRSEFRLPLRLSADGSLIEERLRPMETKAYRLAQVGFEVLREKVRQVLNQMRADEIADVRYRPETDGPDDPRAGTTARESQEMESPAGSWARAVQNLHAFFEQPVADDAQGAKLDEAGRNQRRKANGVAKQPVWVASQFLGSTDFTARREEWNQTYPVERYLDLARFRKECCEAMQRVLQLGVLDAWNPFLRDVAAEQPRREAPKRKAGRGSTANKREKRLPQTLPQSRGNKKPVT